jgi:hypothetical protein
VIDELMPGTEEIDHGNLSLLLIETFATTGAYSFTCKHTGTPN